MSPLEVIANMMKLIAKIKANRWTSRIVLLFISAFIFRIILAESGTVSLDQNTFIAWARSLSNQGYSRFYLGWSDYLPGYLYVLSFLARIEQVLPVSLTVLYKLPAILADLGAAFVIYKIIQKQLNEKWAVLVTTFFLFNPAVIYNSTLWGQVDVLTALFALLSLYFIESKYWLLSALFLAVGTVIKPQAALAALVITLLLVAKRDYKKLVTIGVLAGAIFLVFFIPFANGAPLISFAQSRLAVTLNQYQYGSVNAFNFWGLFGFWQKEGEGFLNSATVGLLIFFVTAAVAARNFMQHKITKYHFLAILFASNFLFFTRMHERHFLPAIVALTAAVGSNLLLLVPVSIFSLVYVLNMRYAQVWIIQNFKSIFSTELIVLFILLAIGSFLLVLFPTLLTQGANVIKKLRTKTFYKELLGLYNEPLPGKPFSFDVTVSQGKKILIGILIFAFATRLFSLSSPSNEYFDEVYHAFTARQILNGNQKAWEWWNESPQGFAYEWTHPPFAKLAMVVGMGIFGENSFGWRFPAAVFGTISVFLIYAIGKKMFDNRAFGLLAAALFSLDGLSLVLSRIGMNDIYVVCFLLFALYLFLDKKLFLSSLAVGLALSSKWTTLWFLPVLVAFFILYKKRLTSRYAYFLIIPIIVYIASYTFLFTSGHSWDIFWGMQKQMWWYHTGLVATHPFSSAWWSWPLLLRPIWLYTGGVVDGMVSNIYAMGNPMIFWGGVVAFLVGIPYIWKDRSKALLSLFAAYLGLFAPWVLSPRIMFLYHYFPSVPFLCLILAYVLMRNRKFILPFLVLSLIVFLYFYPRLTGIPVPLSFNESYYWLPSWR